VQAVDTLRPPGTLDPTAPAYKDWLHLNLFDHATGLTGLVNLSIHGAPGDPRTQVVTTALFDRGDGDWHGAVVPGSWTDAAVGLSGIGTPFGAVAMAGTDVLASFRAAGVTVDERATPAVAAYSPLAPQPFGSGWIGWRVVPQMVASGSVVGPAGRASGRDARATPTRAYHDHNWGRWFWGDDVGWEWGSFVDADATSVVIARTTDRAHRRCGPWTVVLDHDGSRRTFTAERVAAVWTGHAPAPGRRLPGALAAQHPDLRRPRLPGELAIEARSGRDSLALTFRCRSVVQLVLADPMVAGTSFLHEMAGTFRAAGVVGGRDFEAEGLAMVERLE
jgi:hypothetical protein